MSRPIENFLPRIRNVHQTGTGIYTGSCPTDKHPHGDRSRGLSIRETDEGVLLLWCGAGCGGAEIVSSVGLTLADLYPPKLNEPDYHGGKPKVPPIPWKDIFTAISQDLIAIQLMAADIVNGRAFSDEDMRFFHGRVSDLESQIRRARHG